MTQESIVLSTTPPYPGLQMVQDVNKANQALATDFAGPDDPASVAGPHMKWLDTSVTPPRLRRRNTAGTAWLDEGVAGRQSLPIFPANAIPTTDIGPIDVIGIGRMQWGSSSYVPFTPGVGQTWKDKLGERSFNTVFTNTSPRIRFVSVSAYSSAANLLLTLITGGFSLRGNQILTAGFESAVTGAIMPGTTYSIGQIGSGAITLQTWWETE